ncbi:MAG: hypothetical protein ACREJO_16265 [Phycisphaerales bacterium]
MSFGQQPDAFDTRRNTFEEAYFRTRDAELVAKLQKVFDAKMSKEELRKASGVTDEAVLDRLAALNLRGETMTAFKLLPLVELAWADGKVTKDEATAVLAAAVKVGIPPDSQGYARMKEWLDRGPAEDARLAWKMYAEQLRTHLAPAELKTFRDDLLANAKKVAEASGGIFGFSKVSPGEQKVIDAITKALTH